MANSSRIMIGNNDHVEDSVEERKKKRSRSPSSMTTNDGRIKLKEMSKDTQIKFQPTQKRLQKTRPSLSHVSNDPGAVTKITTRLLPISAPAIALTSIILPLDAGNLPRIT